MGTIAPSPPQLEVLSSLLERLVLDIEPFRCHGCAREQLRNDRAETNDGSVYGIWNMLPRYHTRKTHGTTNLYKTSRRPWKETTHGSWLDCRLPLPRFF